MHNKSICIICMQQAISDYAYISYIIYISVCFGLFFFFFWFARIQITIVLKCGFVFLLFTWPGLDDDENRKQQQTAEAKPISKLCCRFWLARNCANFPHWPVWIWSVFVPFPSSSSSSFSVCFLVLSVFFFAALLLLLFSAESGVWKQVLGDTKQTFRPVVLCDVMWCHR